MLCDTRLYFAVRPALEYQAPRAARAAVKVILGTATTAELHAELVACRRAREVAPAEESAPDVESLHRHGERVCELVRQYLRDTTDRWCAYVTAVASDVQHATNDAAQRRARALHTRDAQHNSRRAVWQFRNDALQIATDLEAAIASAGATPEPVVPRPVALVKAVATFRDRLAKAYNTVPTPHILALKEHTEARMRQLEREVAKRFVQRVLTTRLHVTW